MIHVPITSGEKKGMRETLQFFTSLLGLGTFALGALIGIFASTAYDMHVPNLGTGFKSQLGALGVLDMPPRVSDTTTEEAATTPTLAPQATQTFSLLRDTDTVGIVDESANLLLPSSPIITPTVIVLSQTEREGDVITQQVVVDRITLEMTQIKNASLALIAQFDQNCGNWNDACALAYRDTLEVNNRTYERLTKSRNSEMLVLLRYQTLLDEAR